MHLVLVGAGHAHLHVIASLSRLRAVGLHVTVISPSQFWYSGLATGVLAGDYPPALDRIEVDRQVQAAGARFLQDAVVRIDVPGKRLMLASGQECAFDLCSLDVGSESRGLDRFEDHPGCFAVKPIGRLLRLLEQLREDPRQRIAIIGGGVTACELACCLATRIRRSGHRPRICLYAASGIGQALPRRARLRLRDGVRSAGVRVLPLRAEQAHADGVLTTSEGQRHQCDLLIPATGLQAPGWLRDSGLPVDDARGAVHVGDDLRVQGREDLFAIGDCARLPGPPLPSLGVFAVRGSRVLVDNLEMLAARSDKPLRPYHPQRRYLSIINLGRRRALARYGPFAWSGPASWYLKDRIDRKWIDAYRP